MDDPAGFNGPEVVGDIWLSLSAGVDGYRLCTQIRASDDDAWQSKVEFQYTGTAISTLAGTLGRAYSSVSSMRSALCACQCLRDGEGLSFIPFRMGLPKTIGKNVCIGAMLVRLADYEANADELALGEG